MLILKQYSRSSVTNHSKKKVFKFCHFFNNRESCKFGDDCEYEHTRAPNCKDDKDCKRRFCMFSHKNKSFSQYSQKKDFQDGRQVRPRNSVMQPQESRRFSSPPIMNPWINYNQSYPPPRSQNQMGQNMYQRNL